ncbi:MAG: hypothetical protein LBC18_09580 [Opitutaceae bacterium]|jgi:hypothetical protein|nr:hypothetical protein [Opitutaceae bacterium]
MSRELIIQLISILVSAVLVPICISVIRELWKSRIERVKIMMRLEAGDVAFAEVKAKQAEIESKLGQLEIEIIKLKARKD